MVCRLTKEKGVREVSLQQKQVESLEVEEVELLNFGDEQRVRREVASNGNQVKSGGEKEIKDFYLQDCEEADQWCKIVPYLLNIEAETEELGQGRKIRKEDKEGVSVEVMLKENPSSSLEDRLKIVHVRHSLSWAPFLTIIGVFVVVMAAFVLITSMVMRKLNRVSASTKVSELHQCYELDTNLLISADALPESLKQDAQERRWQRWLFCTLGGETTLATMASGSATKKFFSMFAPFYLY